MYISKAKLAAGFLAAALLFTAALSPALGAPPAPAKNTVTLCVNSPLAYVNNKLTPLDEENSGVYTVVEEGRAFAPLAFLNAAFSTKQTMSGQTKSIDGQAFAPVRAYAQALGQPVFYERGLIVIGAGADALDAKADRAEIDRLLSGLNALPTVDTAEKFAQLVGESGMGAAYGEAANDGGVLFFRADSAKSMEVQAAAPEAATGNAAPAAANDTAGPGSFSQTNVQVEGVDEADIIKTDGEYIYIVGSDKIHVVKAMPASSMRVESVISFPGDVFTSDTFTPSEMYVDGESLIVTGFFNKMVNKTTNRDIGWQRYDPVTRTIEYDISDKKNLKAVRTLDTPGNYVSSRKIGKDVYIVTSLPVYSLYDGKKYVQPVYRDTAAGQADISVPYKSICYFPGVQAASVLTVAGFSAGTPDVKAVVKTCLGGSESIYASRENLYVAAQEYAIMPYSTRSSYSPRTAVYKFALANGAATFTRKGVINGSLLNQFSMDEYGGYFRAATTSYGSDGQQSNNLYILSPTMEVAGKIEDIAPGERIYSARFMGDRAYMVTFKNVDPLFVIDVKDPTAPKILGALKIPGYSDYLHPYGENRLIGFGKDTAETKTGALVQGMKIAMFDVSDVTNPKEMFKEIIGGRGTESPLLYNHKALLFDAARGLMAFPVTVNEVSDGSDPSEWGQFAFQGAYVYNVSPQKGFTLRGKITHLTDEDILKSGMYGGTSEHNINRVVTIGENVYTSSNGMLKATSLQSMKELGKVTLP